MALNNNNGQRRPNGSFAPSSPLDHLLAQALMGRLHLRPPYLGTTSFLSHSLDDLPLPNLDFPYDDADADADAEENDEEEEELGPLEGARQRRAVAREEAKLEREIIRIVHSGSAREVLKPNSGQSVAIGDHNICVGVHEEPRSDYRVWEWHGHIMLFDEESGYDAEYIYGNYFERVHDTKRENDEEDADSEKEEEEEEKKKEKVVANSGLRDLIDGSKDSIGGSGGRVLHRNSLNAGSKPAK